MICLVVPQSGSFFHWYLQTWWSILHLTRYRWRVHRVPTVGNRPIPSPKLSPNFPNSRVPRERRHNPLGKISTHLHLRWIRRPVEFICEFNWNFRRILRRKLRCENIFLAESFYIGCSHTHFADRVSARRVSVYQQPSYSFDFNPKWRRMWTPRWIFVFCGF